MLEEVVAQKFFIQPGSARDLTPYPFIYHFGQKRYPLFIYLLLTNGTPLTY